MRAFQLPVLISLCLHIHGASSAYTLWWNDLTHIFWDNKTNWLQESPSQCPGVTYRYGLNGTRSFRAQFTGNFARLIGPRNTSMQSYNLSAVLDGGEATFLSIPVADTLYCDFTHYRTPIIEYGDHTLNITVSNATWFSFERIEVGGDAPRPTGASTTATATSTTSTSGNNNSLSSAEIGGIVGGILGALILVAGVGICLYKRRKGQGRAPLEMSQEVASIYKAPESGASGPNAVYDPALYYNSTPPLQQTSHEQNEAHHSSPSLRSPVAFPVPVITTTGNASPTRGGPNSPQSPNVSSIASASGTQPLSLYGSRPANYPPQAAASSPTSPQGRLSLYGSHQVSASSDLGISTGLLPSQIDRRSQDRSR